MKKIILNIFAMAMVIIAPQLSNAQITTPSASSAGSVSSTVGLTDVKIDYSRPKLKGRQIFGEGSDFLQPYGDIWRSGANSGSILTISTDVEIAGQKVEAGEYLIFTIPGKDEWNFMLYSDLSIGGSVANYDKAKEVLTTTVKPTMLTKAIETLTYSITDISEDNTTANIELTWADVSIKVPMKVDYDAIVMAEIEKNTKVNVGNYSAAANYYFNTGKDLEQALKWMNMYLAEGKNSDQFWNVHTKAKILAKMGKKKEAKVAAEESLAKAKAAANGDFGYIKRNEDLIKTL